MSGPDMQYPVRSPDFQGIGFYLGVANGDVFYDPGNRYCYIRVDILDLILAIRGRLDQLIAYFYHRGRLIVVRIERKREGEATARFHGISSSGRIQRGTFNGWKGHTKGHCWIRCGRGNAYL